MNIGVYTPDLTIINDPNNMMNMLRRTITLPYVVLTFFNTISYSVPYDNIIILKMYKPGMSIEDIFVGIIEQAIDYMSKYKNRCKLFLITHEIKDEYMELCNVAYDYIRANDILSNVYDISFISTANTVNSVEWSKAVLNMYMVTIDILHRSSQGIDTSRSMGIFESNLNTLSNNPKLKHSYTGINRLYNYILKIGDVNISMEGTREHIVDSMRTDNVDSDTRKTMRYYFDIYKWHGYTVSELVRKYTFTPDTKVSINYSELDIFFNDWALSSNEGIWILELLRAPFVLHTIQFMITNILMFYGLKRRADNSIEYNTGDINHMRRLSIINQNDIDLLTMVVNMDLYICFYIYALSKERQYHGTRVYDLPRTLMMKLESLDISLRTRYETNIKGIQAKHTKMLEIRRNYLRNGWVEVKIV